MDPSEGVTESGNENVEGEDRFAENENSGESNSFQVSPRASSYEFSDESEEENPAFFTPYESENDEELEMGEENTREHMDRAITKENQEGNKTTDHEDGVANEERAGRKAWNLEGEWQPRHSVMGTQFEEQMVAYDIGLDIFGPGVFGAKVELGNLQEEDQYKEGNETHCPLSPIHSSITPTSPTPPCSPTSIPETPSPRPMTDLDSLFAQASRESPRWIFRPTEFAARAGNGTLLALPPIGKVIRPGPLAVQTLSTVFQELGRCTDMPSAVGKEIRKFFLVRTW